MHQLVAEPKPQEASIEPAPALQSVEQDTLARFHAAKRRFEAERAVGSGSQSTLSPLRPMPAHFFSTTPSLPSPRAAPLPEYSEWDMPAEPTTWQPRMAGTPLTAPRPAVGASAFRTTHQAPAYSQKSAYSHAFYRTNLDNLEARLSRLRELRHAVDSRCGVL